MVQIKGFKAVRPRADLAKSVAVLPYDVMNRAEAAAMAEGNPYSFLRVTRSEIEFPEGADPYSEDVYKKAKDNLEKFISEGALLREDKDSIYIYRLIRNGIPQTGVVALSSVAEYQNGTIKVHEKTRPEKVKDRTKHITVTRAQTGPVFLTFRNTDKLDNLIAEAVKETPLYDFTADDGIAHTIWRVKDPDEFVNAFKDVPNTYIADGHHRANSSSNCYDLLKEEGAAFFLTVIFPAGELRILPYNRVIKTSKLSSEEIINRLGESFDVKESDLKEPSSKRHFCVYMAKKWYELSLKKEIPIPTDPVEALDVSLLHKYALEPIFNIVDERTDNNIAFIGGIRGTKELERLVDVGDAVIAFSMYPVTIQDLLSIADAGEIMAPKSTWFEPKLRSGLLVNLID